MINDPTCCGTDLAQLQSKLDDANAERANMYPLLRDAENKNATYAKELDLLVRELDRTRDAFEEADTRVQELTEETRELRQQLADARNQRDDMRTQS